MFQDLGEGLVEGVRRNEGYWLARSDAKYMNKTRGMTAIMAMTTVNSNRVVSSLRPC